MVLGYGCGCEVGEWCLCVNEAGWGGGGGGVQKVGAIPCESAGACHRSLEHDLPPAQMPLLHRLLFPPDCVLRKVEEVQGESGDWGHYRATRLVVQRSPIFVLILVLVLVLPQVIG